MKRSFAIFAGALASIASPWAADQIDFARDIKPLLEVQCLSCHGAEKPKGGLLLDTRANAMKGGDDGAALVPGKPGESPLFASTILPPDTDKAMPPKGERLQKTQTEKL